MYDFKGKTALVTGGSRGIGRAVAQVLGEGKARVVVSYAGNEAAAQEAAKLVTQAGAEKVKLLRFDVADAAACAAAVDEIVTEMGSIDILVNNAGISVDGLVMRLKDQDIARQIDVNLKGALNLIRAATRPMMKQKGGSIVNLTSVVGETGNAGQAVYSATKAGLIGLTKSVAKELASRNIRVNAVAPGFIDTEMTQGLPEAARQKMFEQIPLARLGSAREVAECVAWLASARSSYVTGEVIRVNGGMYM
jgi:3-oxoacyl-[acyl-carrier protein] reductase